MIIREKALLRNRYTNDSEANTRNALYINVHGVTAINPSADTRFRLDTSSTIKTTKQESKAWNT